MTVARLSRRPAQRARRGGAVVLAAGAAGAVALAGLTAATTATAATAATPSSSVTAATRVARSVTVAGLQRHLRAFQAIADANGGNRAAGTPGYDASRDYVAARLRAAGYAVTIQPFSYPTYDEVAPATLAQTAPTPTTYAAPATVPFTTSGDVTAPIVPVDVNLTGDRASTSGCETTDFAGFPAGDVALIQRGVCTYGVKLANAQAAGASAVVFFNQGDTPEREGPLEPGNDTPTPFPAIGVDFATGAALATGSPTVHLVTATALKTVHTTNVIAQTRRGDRRHVVAIGGHLDSVPAGAGINDDGSGSALVLELAIQMARRHVTPVHAVRFGFWGAEEAGIHGSAAYVRSLRPAQADAISAYLNFDMIASPNGLRLIYDADGGGDPEAAAPAGSVRIEHAFDRWFASRRLTTGLYKREGRSDDAPFAAAGIPVGGLYSGAEEVKTEAQWRGTGGVVGVPADPNYHTPRDRLSNIDATLMGQLAQAGAFVTARLALDAKLLPRRAPTPAVPPAG
jgi:Zn-dependent M28 family amino/carboxypeptidase